MGTVQVKALRTGYYEHRRQREGSIFIMKESDYQQPDGKICKWVEAIEGFEVNQATGKVVEKKKPRAAKKEA